MHVGAVIVPRGPEFWAVKRGWSVAGPTFISVSAGAADVDESNALARGDGGSAVVLGLCGALDPSLRVGQPVVYTQIIDGTATLDLDPQLSETCALALQAPGARAAHVAEVVGSVGAKAALRRATGAGVIDMEAATIARILQSRAVRFAMVRVVSDAANRELPDLRDVYDRRGHLQALQLTLAFVRTPARSVRFIVDAIASLQQLRRTAEQLSRF